MELHGRKASPGTAFGPAYVISPGAPIGNVPDGCILVMEMTTTDILPFIRRIRGIITATGGVTCHAAIIAREFHIPALVACSSALTIQDGQEIILYADEGRAVVQDRE